MKKLFIMFMCISLVCFFVQTGFLKNVEAKPFAEHNPAAQTGLVAVSIISSVIYLPFKISYAILGGITSGFTYSLSLGKEAEYASNLANKCFTGDWYIHPNILTGAEELNYSGPDDITP